ncbi:acyltransferase [Sphingobium fuliginis]|uniref:Acyltransferase n=1 Tax=Sphingobium fuliginis ATCC 27551 TaxID=1208342 RepID=A0A5B8CA83_SPHSA|nr:MULTISPECIES: acyltransferase [Sphingobium]PNQ01792.1 succinyltransferase [Sphingobium sp. SA916]QDC36049.1 acyltransferase [Sphingobium fuliginis ATCC 27551]RYL99327.1 acyltransferase [Sphingobium fuliginis]UXC91116.1 acyltransferase [Sphingobium sp. RSMS]
MAVETLAENRENPVSRVLTTDAARRSDAISIARVICILGVVYVHAWTGLNGHDLESLRGTSQDSLRWGLMEVFGRSAVPLLGLISGWLVEGSSRTHDWLRHVGRKARTILLPMILWNALAILFVSGAAWMLGLSAPVPSSTGWMFEELFIVSRNPDINVQMPFLRDLFLCMLAAPLFVRLPGWALGAVAAMAALCQIMGWGPPVLMRASILFFFIMGIVARREGLADRVAALPWMVAAPPFALLMTAQLYISLHPGALPPGVGTAVLDMAVRVAAALFFWRLAWSLAASAARGMLLRIEPFAFFLFCSHLILIWLGGPVLGVVFGKLGSPFYPAYLLVQPLLVLVAVVLLGSLLSRAAPGLAKLLSGGRLMAV